MIPALHAEEAVATWYRLKRRSEMNMTLLLIQNKARKQCVDCIGDIALSDDVCWNLDAICKHCGHFRTWVKVPCPYGNCPYGD